MTMIQEHPEAVGFGRYMASAGAEPFEMANTDSLLDELSQSDGLLGPGIGFDVERAVESDRAESLVSTLLLSILTASLPVRQLTSNAQQRPLGSATLGQGVSYGDEHLGDRVVITSLEYGYGALIFTDEPNELWGTTMTSQEFGLTANDVLRTVAELSRVLPLGRQLMTHSLIAEMTHQLNSQPWVVSSAPVPDFVPASVPAAGAGGVEQHGRHVGSIGVRAVSQMTGNTGATTALHAIDETEVVTVDGQPVVVDVRNRSADLAFLRGAPGPDATGWVEPTPRQREAVSFQSVIQDEVVSTHVTDWDRSVLFTDPMIRPLVYTPNVIVPGDSGVALRDGEDSLVGFCMSYSGPSAEENLATWVWAKHALSSTQLRLTTSSDDEEEAPRGMDP